MGQDGELPGILRDVVQFLECLREVKLPVSLESIRENLLTRTKDTLSMFMVERMGRSTSPESYLNMNAGGLKGLVALLKGEADVQEYVGAEEQHVQTQQQDYYETFRTGESTTATVVNPGTDQSLRSKDEEEEEKEKEKKKEEEELENTLQDIYLSFSAAQTKSKSQKAGPLYRKEGKKLFVFEQYRACWVGLVGQHLLIYGSDRDVRPCMILPIRGYMARPAPNAIPRDQRRSESTFEIFRPGSRTLQFVARTPKDMEQWVAKISELQGCCKELPKILSTVPVENELSQTDPRDDSSCKEEQYQDVGSLIVDKVSEEPPTVPGVRNEDGEANDSPKDVQPEITNSPAPPLPARIPRKLPCPPVLSYQFPDEEEDDIYHRIEDVRDTIRYGNVRKTFQTDDRSKEPETYDDIRASTKDESKPEDEEKPRRKNFDRMRNEATYDDTTSAVLLQEDSNAPVLVQQEEFVPYDDVESLLSSARSTKVQRTERVEESSTKSPQKKSFLDRVRSRKESPRKVEKKTKRKTATPPAVNTGHDLPTYDDVSDLVAKAQEAKRVEEDTEYTCPPPPRPVYVKPPTIATDALEQLEFYDDVTACREVYKDEETCKLDQRVPRKLNYVCGGVAARPDIDTSVVCENIDNSQRSIEDTEHYQTPRSELRDRPVDQREEELYDDVALLADFTARQKEILGKKDSSEDASKLQASLEKRSWNRFVNGRKSKLIDPTAAEANSRVSNGSEDAEDLSEQQSLMRMNTFQKLISKMENSLGKAPVRTTSSVLINKTNLTNNAQCS